jgi:heat shock protein HtpX
VIAVNTGLLQVLDRAEVEGVLAHEIGHILNRDTLISAIAATFAGAIGSIGHMFAWGAMFGGYGRSNQNEGGGALGGLFAMLIAPIMATLIQLAVSRSREYQADVTSARLTGRPLELADALAKLEQGTRAYASRGYVTAEPAVAHMMIVNPLRGEGIASLFSTHPPIAARIERCGPWLAADAHHQGRLGSTSFSGERGERPERPRRGVSGTPSRRCRGFTGLRHQPFSGRCSRNSA